MTGGLEVPDLPSNCSFNCNSMAAGIKSKRFNWSFSIALRIMFFNITKIKNFDLLVFSTSSNKVFSEKDRFTALMVPSET